MIWRLLQHLFQFIQKEIDHVGEIDRSLISLFEDHVQEKTPLTELEKVNQTPRKILPAHTTEPKEFSLVEGMADGTVFHGVLGPAERNALRIVLNTARMKEKNTGKKEDCYAHSTTRGCRAENFGGKCECK